jgi:uncharacterized membrane protein
MLSSEAIEDGDVEADMAVLDSVSDVERTMDGHRRDLAVPDSTTGQLRASEQRLRDIETQIAERLESRQEHPSRNANDRYEESFSRLDRLALAITTHVGTFGFFLIIVTWTVLWLGWNTLAPRSVRFDPAPAFVFWLFISNMIQICLMPLIMVGQNLLGRHAELRAENDFEINQKAEEEIETILLSLERQAALIERQDSQILRILHYLDSTSAPAD